MDRIQIADIEKWREKIAGVMEDLEAVDDKSEEMLNNMKAYVSDSKFFQEKGDLVRSFEAIIWAWAIYETCKEFSLFINR